MLRGRNGFVLFTVIIFAELCFAQGETAVPFLIISSYAEANGMGETSVAVCTDDPLGMTVNPAHLGMQSLNEYISFGYNRSDWFPGMNKPDLYYLSQGVSAGMNLRELIPGTPELALGVGYSRVFLNLGEFERITETGERRGTFRAYDSADHFTVSVGIDFRIKAAAGMTLKQIYSKPGPRGEEQEINGGTARLYSHDYGLLVNVPVIEIFSNLLHDPAGRDPSIVPFLNLNYGLAYNNLGEKSVKYSEEDIPDPLPRYVRIGAGFDLGFSYRMGRELLRPFSFTWSREANDILVRRYPVNDNGFPVITEWSYRSGTGDISFYDEVILGKTNAQTIQKTGWEIGLLEIAYIRKGSFSEDIHAGGRNFNTSGFSIRSSGISKLLRAYDAPVIHSRIIGFLINNLDIRYNYSRLKTIERNHPLDGTKFNAVVLTFYN